MSVASTATVAAMPAAGSSLLGGTRAMGVGGGTSNAGGGNNVALFREIHKNTWLKRLTADGKKITVGPKKSERSWVVFCVHDDSQAILEGYAEPRQAASHNPEWIISMQETQHISHALIPNSHEFEFVVTLSNEVVRFHAMSWEVMQEWVETLRSKLREMKILSPRENLYTKLPEIRAPLLPTRDPTSPLPAPPPVPAALVPGVERVVPQSVLHSTNAEASNSSATTSSEQSISESASAAPITITAAPTPASVSATSQAAAAAVTHSNHTATPVLTSMSNTLTQNLLNMLSDPITAYSVQLHADELTSESFLHDEDDDSNDEDSDLNIELTDVATEAAPSCDFLNGLSSSSPGNSVRLDVNNERVANDQTINMENLKLGERLIPRPQTSRSLSAGAADNVRWPLTHATKTQLQRFVSNTKTKTSTNSNNNITELEISNVDVTATTALPTTSAATSNADATTTNITIIQVSNINDKQQPQQQQQHAKYANNKRQTADIFTFPEDTIKVAATSTPSSSSISLSNNNIHEEYKCNVQIIPSNSNSSTIQVLGQQAVANQYSTAVQKSCLPPPTTTGSLCDVATAVVAADTTTTATTNSSSTSAAHLDANQVTTVHVGDTTTATTASSSSIYGTCYSNSGSSDTPTAAKKTIILSANTSGVTNILVNNNASHQREANLNFSSTKQHAGSVRYEKVFLSSSTPLVSTKLEPMSQSRVLVAAAPSQRMQDLHTPPTTCDRTQKPSPSNTVKQKNTPTANMSPCSPAAQRKRLPHIATPTTASLNDMPPIPTRFHLLRRGLTEAVITARPSRKDLCLTKISPPAKNKSSYNSNNNGDASSTSAAGGVSETCALPPPRQSHAVVGRTRSESLEQRRRSSSTSEAHTQRARVPSNNNEFTPSRVGAAAAATSSSAAAANAMRMQQPPHLYRSLENAAQCGVSSSTSNATTAAAASVNSPLNATKRMTLREQQVMQLRREIMHPGGVRLQLRRKDCVGSIAWVDGYGAVWVAGWKQKEHPVLYNALHIGDQLLSIAGITISAAAEANKVIRSTNTLFVEVLVRRMPLGRGYAIRRDREGQCLGLIRDGNTSTIVDVVPNSLAARHGLPPKAQSCDGTTLTFWVLTEINGRPLNLFFKEHEIRDRLNSVGRDISILVQPSDLITKLKKQLKSLRGYKDYLVQ